MEEKERYELFGEHCIKDNDVNARCQLLDTYKACVILNQQDKRIKELESKLRVSNSLNASLSLDYYEFKKRYDSQEKLLTQKCAETSRLTLENQQLKEESGYIIFSDGYDENGNKIHRQEFVKYKDKFKRVIEENKQLKQSQKQLAIKELNDYLETDEVAKREYYQKVDKNDRAKDKEIKKLKDKIKELQDYTENTANLIDNLTEDSVSARTDLAISELEKVKQLLDGYKWYQGENEYDFIDDYAIDWSDVIKIFDNQIKKLKGE